MYHLLSGPKSSPQSYQYGSSPDPSANPYITFALVIRAALYGLKNGIELPEPVNVNLYRADGETLRGLEKLPADPDEAKRAALADEFIRGIIPKQILDIYCGI